MEHVDNELQIESVESRLEFGFWAWVWDAIKSIWEHLYVSGRGGF